jgi:hypothetical protein
LHYHELQRREISSVYPVYMMIDEAAEVTEL